MKLWRETLARFGVVELSAPMKVSVRSADRTAMEVQKRLTREIQRNGPFVDPVAALDFVSGALLRAERQLDRQRAAAWAAGEADSLVHRDGEPKSKGALGVPTLA